MKELAGRLAALDPDAGAALRVIAYFDRLLEHRAGLEALVRAAAVLSGSPARLVDTERGVRMRVRPDGRRADDDGPVDPAWPRAPLTPGADVAVRTAGGALFLEHPGPPDGVHAMVLERATAAVRAVLERTRGRAPADDPALVEVLLDASAPLPVRLRAAARLGLDAERPVRAVASSDGGARIETAAAPAPAERTRTARTGIGPAVDLADLPRSWAAARIALRLTAEGTARDPGPRTVYADDLGALTLLADAVGPGTPAVPDVAAVERAVTEVPWAAATLYAVAVSPSLRAAAAELTVHHSTLQERLTHAEHLLGWDVRAPAGRLRLQLALAVRKLRQSTPTDAPAGTQVTETAG
ncbi:transcriptional regulator, CdaR [Actinobacteria bacterium OK074]|nr:transcriptional regulator, CdaR [Actinobacteria bacterium OK074]